MIICTHCGWRNEDEQSEFCASCGRYLEWAGQRIVPPPPEEPEEEPVDEEERHRRFIQRVVEWVRDPGHHDGQTSRSGNGAGGAGGAVNGSNAGGTALAAGSDVSVTESPGDPGDPGAPGAGGPTAASGPVDVTMAVPIPMTTPETAGPLVYGPEVPGLTPATEAAGASLAGATTAGAEAGAGAGDGAEGGAGAEAGDGPDGGAAGGAVVGAGAGAPVGADAGATGGPDGPAGGAAAGAATGGGPAGATGAATVLAPTAVVAGGPIATKLTALVATPRAFVPDLTADPERPVPAVAPVADLLAESPTGEPGTDGLAPGSAAPIVRAGAGSAAPTLPSPARGASVPPATPSTRDSTEDSAAEPATDETAAEDRGARDDHGAATTATEAAVGFAAAAAAAGALAGTAGATTAAGTGPALAGTAGATAAAGTEAAHGTTAPTLLAGTSAVVGAPAARRPGQVDPGEFRPKRAPASTVPDRAPQKGDTVCQTCGLSNDPTRRFCARCATFLLLPIPPPVRVGIWRRFWRRVWIWLTVPLHLHRRRVAVAGTRPGRWRTSGSAAAATDPKASRLKKLTKWRPPRVTLTQLKKLVPIVVILLAVLSFVGPYKHQIRNEYERVKNYVTKAVNIQYVPIVPVATQASSFVAGHNPSAATDSDPTTFWAVRTGHGVGQTLTIDFAQSESVAGFSMLSGDQTKGAKSFADTYRPAKVRLTFSSGRSTTLTIKNTAKFQNFKLIPRSTRWLEVKILAVYPGKQPICAVTEATAYVRT